MPTQFCDLVLVPLPLLGGHQSHQFRLHLIDRLQAALGKDSVHGLADVVSFLIDTGDGVQNLLLDRTDIRGQCCDAVGAVLVVYRYLLD